MKESALQSQVKTLLLLKGYTYFRANGGSARIRGRYVPFYHWRSPGMRKPMVKGFPDVLAFGSRRDEHGNHEPITLFLELKRPGNLKGGTDEQKQFISNMIDHGHKALFVDQLDDLQLLLERIDNGTE